MDSLKGLLAKSPKKGSKLSLAHRVRLDQDRGLATAPEHVCEGLELRGTIYC